MAEPRQPTDPATAVQYLPCCKTLSAFQLAAGKVRCSLMCEFRERIRSLRGRDHWQKQSNHSKFFLMDAPQNAMTAILQPKLYCEGFQEGGDGQISSQAVNRNDPPRNCFISWYDREGHLVEWRYRVSELRVGPIDRQFHLQRIY